MIVLALVLERWCAHRIDWSRSQGDVRGDIASFVGVFVVLDGFIKYGAPLVVVALLGAGRPDAFGLPLWLDVILAGLVIELGAYVAHRLHHQSSWLWTLHAMHHSTQRLYVLNNFRFHPINHLLNSVFIVLAPLMVGFTADAVLIYSVATLPVLLLRHAPRQLCAQLAYPIVRTCCR